MAIEFMITQRVEASPDRVFAALVDLDGWQQWMPNLIRLERLTGGEVAVGSKWRETRKVFGKEAAEVFEVTRLEPGHRLDVYVDGALGSSRSGEYRFTHLVDPEGTGALLTLEGSIGGMGKVMEMVGRVFAGSMKKAIARDLAALAAHVESG